VNIEHAKESAVLIEQKVRGDVHPFFKTVPTTQAEIVRPRWTVPARRKVLAKHKLFKSEYALYVRDVTLELAPFRLSEE
jgi:hypothetical protein